MTRPRASFANLVAGEQERSLCLPLSADDVRAAESLARQRGWIEASDGDNWPLLFVAFGLAALTCEHELARVDLADPAGRDAFRARLRQAHFRLEGRVAPLRFAAFELARTNRILEIKDTALRIDNRGMRLRLGEEAAG